jgi:hypothetical protein
MSESLTMSEADASESLSVAAFQADSTPTEMTIGSVGGAAAPPPSSPFSSGVQSDSALEASFFGVTRTNARRVVYLIDASGSVIDTMPLVLRELRRVINDLSEKQRFTVIFFQSQDVIEVPPPGLKRATRENIERVYDWMDPARRNIVPSGLSSPINALQKSLSYRPDQIFLLSDDITGQGVFEVDRNQLLEAIRETNRKGTNINTFQFLYPDPLASVLGKGTMEAISDQHKGMYKYLDRKQLGISGE